MYKKRFIVCVQLIHTLHSKDSVVGIQQFEHFCVVQRNRGRQCLVWKEVRLSHLLQHTHTLAHTKAEHKLAAKSKRNERYESRSGSFLLLHCLVLAVLKAVESELIILTVLRVTSDSLWRKKGNQMLEIVTVLRGFPLDRLRPRLSVA
jgi:hypothetical protein